MEAKIEILKQVYVFALTSEGACNTMWDHSDDDSYAYNYCFGSKVSRTYKRIIQLLNDNKIRYTTERFKVPIEAPVKQKYYISERILISRNQDPNQEQPICKGQQIFKSKDYDDLMRDIFKSLSDEEIIEYEDTEPGRRCWFKTPQKEYTLRLWNVSDCGEDSVLVEAQLHER